MPYLNRKLAKKQYLPNAEDFSQFYCFKKNIPSLLIKLPHSELIRQQETYEHFLENQSDSEESSSGSERDEYYDEEYDSERKQERRSRMRTQQRAERIFRKQREEQERLLAAKVLESIQEVNTKPIEMLLFNGLEPSAGNQTGDTMLAEMWKARTEFANRGLPANRTQLFHKYDWKWKNQNVNTNMEFFNRVISQRLSDGFIIVNRYSGTSDFFHLVKVLRAHKDRFTVNRQKGRGMSANYSEDKYQPAKD